MEKPLESERSRKGKRLEREFSEWMKSKLGFAKTKLREPITGKVSERSYEVDIHGIKYSKIMINLWKLGMILLFVALYAIITNDSALEQTAENIVSIFDPSFAKNALLVIGVAGFAIGLYGKKKSKIDVWVECKNQKTNVKRHQIQKLISSVQDVRDLEEHKWNPKEVIMVSGTDFDADALNFAKEYDVSCYRKTETGFEEVNL